MICYGNLGNMGGNLHKNDREMQEYSNQAENAQLLRDGRVFVRL